MVTAPGRTGSGEPPPSAVAARPMSTTQPAPSTTALATLLPFLSTRASVGESAQVCGLSIVAASGVGQPLGYFSRLVGSSCGRPIHVTASAIATMKKPIAMATVSSCS